MRKARQAAIFKRFYWWQEECSRRIAERPRRAALKLYLALAEELGDEPAVRAAGVNCLNESFHSDSTPCLAWDLLHRHRGLTWGCEADTVSMLTQLLLQRTLDTPLMMTNLYPFLMGQAALAHERIEAFPDLPDPRHHVLVAHCGYLGVLPASMATSWALRPKVLAIVGDDASAIDRVADGPRPMERLPSHHAILLQGHRPTELRMLGRLFGLTVEAVA